MTLVTAVLLIFRKVVYSGISFQTPAHMVKFSEAWTYYFQFIHSIFVEMEFKLAN